MLQKMILSYSFPFVRIILDMTYSFPALLFQTQLPLLSIKMHNLENTLVQKSKKHLPPVASKYELLEEPQNIT
jgi:hypothetical protein